jgi:hypothetical protein
MIQSHQNRVVWVVLGCLIALLGGGEMLLTVLGGALALAMTATILMFIVAFIVK